MVDLSKVSQKIMEQVDAIKQMSGNSRKIDTPAEYESLSKLLAGEAGAGNKEYIQGFMIEYENKYPTLEKLEADKAQAELEKGLTEAGKKEIDDLLKQYDKSEKKFKPNDDIEMELQALLNNKYKGFTAEEKEYLKQELIKRHIKTEAPVVNVPTRDKAEYAGEEKYDSYYALQGYTTEEDQALIREAIGKVNSDNVMDFLGIYEHTDDQGFFQQLVTELGFDDKNDLALKVANDLKAYVEKYRPDAEKSSRIDSFIKSLQEGNTHTWQNTVMGYGNSWISTTAKDLDEFVLQELKILGSFDIKENPIE